VACAADRGGSRLAEEADPGFDPERAVGCKQSTTPGRRGIGLPRTAGRFRATIGVGIGIGIDIDVMALPTLTKSSPIPHCF